MNYKLINPINKNLTAIEQIFINRGFKDKNDIFKYLNTTDDNILDPTSIQNIKDGVKLLISHISNNSKIMIQVDSDCDGYTSAAVLINYLNRLFPSFVQNNIYYRVHDKKIHGILLETVPEDVKLVIAPDSSSNEYEIHQTLKEKGIDVLVIDHHNADKVSEYACVINNQLCDYPTKSLSGVGMVYKFCSFIDQIMDYDCANDYLDLVAVGIVADMMDLKDFETKHLIKKGLDNIRNPFLKGMVEKNSYSLKDNITPFGVAFYIAPYINAVTRSGTAAEKLFLFESMLEFKSYEQIPSTKRGCKGQKETRVEQSCRNCINIKKRQGNSRDESVEIIKKIIEDNNLLENKILFIKLPKDKETDSNLTGLIANQLMAEYQKPVLLLNQKEHEDGSIWWEGSGRGYSKSSLTDFQDFLKWTGFAEYVEGHDNAFGFGIKDENVTDFIKSTNQALKDYDFSPLYQVDLVYDMNKTELYNSISSDIMGIGDLNDCWGQGLEEPYVIFKNVKITSSNLTLMKGSTLKITIPNTNISFIKFKSSEEEFNDLYTQMGVVEVDILGYCKINTFNGISKPQIEVKDYEITKRERYYF